MSPVILVWPQPNPSQPDTRLLSKTDLIRPHSQQAGSRVFSYHTDPAWVADFTHSVELIEEVPLVITVNGLAHAVMMITPVDVEPFVVGFLHSEGIIHEKNDIRDLSIRPQTHNGIESLAADITLSPRMLHTYKQQQTARKGSTGCGLCGIESLADALPSLEPLSIVETHCPLSNEQLTRFRDTLPEHQVLGRQVGAIHAALLIDAQGNVLTSHEDIGRHNALDKVIGWALMHSHNVTGASVLMTSRCSTELIQKAVRAGIHTLIHLASPSSLAVQQARSYHLNLIHLPRQGEPRFYVSFSDRMGLTTYVNDQQTTSVKRAVR